MLRGDRKRKKGISEGGKEGRISISKRKNDSQEGEVEDYLKACFWGPRAIV